MQTRENADILNMGDENMRSDLAIPHVHVEPLEDKAILALRVSTNLPGISKLTDREQELFFLELASEMVRYEKTGDRANLEQFLMEVRQTISNLGSKSLPEREKMNLMMEVQSNLPWLEFLPADDQSKFFLEAAVEMIDMAKTERTFEVRELIDKWESIAAEYAYAEPLPDQAAWDQVSDEALSIYESENHAH